MNSQTFRILLVGSGGREHALAWKLNQSPYVERIFVVPGNGGTASLEKVSNVTSVSQENFAGLVDFAKENHINLLVPGPEAPLVDGIVDHFKRQLPDIRCFGPSKAAARMEGSKAFAKDFLRRHNIPTAAYRNFSSYKLACEYLDSVDHSVVLKASGLAAGKGVIIPSTKIEAQKALKNIMLDKQFGAAGDEVVIEEYMEGDELSILTFSDGHTLCSLPPAQDHKRIFDGDLGPNTGGMGAYAPTRIAPAEVVDLIHEKILQPTIDGMREEGYPFTGVLFTGLMMTKSGPKVLEYNVRFGDPETQSLLPLMNSDLAMLMFACTNQELSSYVLDVRPDSAATVVIAAFGYPDKYEKGVEIQLNDVNDDVILFHAGTSLIDGHLKSSGGRVIASTAIAKTLEEAIGKAYAGVGCIHFDGMQYRKDIAGRALC